MSKMYFIRKQVIGQNTHLGPTMSHPACTFTSTSKMELW